MQMEQYMHCLVQMLYVKNNTLNINKNIYHYLIIMYYILYCISYEIIYIYINIL